jgi:hypothetical protein
MPSIGFPFGQRPAEDAQPKKPDRQAMIFRRLDALIRWTTTVRWTR